VIKTLDISSEVALVLVPIVLICRILLNPKHKAVIIGTFAARLPVIAFTVLHLYYLNESMDSENDRGLAVVQPVVWLQITLLWSMVTASLPSFRPLVSAFETVVEDSSERSNTVSTGAALFMGSDKENVIELPATLQISGMTRLSQLDTVESNRSQQVKLLFKDQQRSISGCQRRKTTLKWAPSDTAQILRLPTNKPQNLVDGARFGASQNLQ
jgi:hypothetical protein